MTAANIPDAHEFDIDIPAGKVLLAECGQLTANDRRAKKHTLDTKTGWGRATVKLIAATAGFTVAGSMMRWDNGYFGVVWEDSNGSTHGRHYRTFEEAINHFNRIPEKA